MTRTESLGVLLVAAGVVLLAVAAAQVAGVWACLVVVGVAAVTFGLLVVRAAVANEGVRR